MSQSLLHRRALLTAVGCSLAVGSCDSLIGPTQQPLQLYLLRPQLGPVTSLPAVGAQLSVARPEGVQSLETTRIALERGETMDYFADAQWSDTVPRLLQSLLVEAFEASGRIRAVAPDAAGLRADVQLQSEIRDFTAHYDSENGPPDVVVAIVVRLLSVDRGIVIGTFETRHDARAAQNSVAAVVAAFDTATAAVLEDIVPWTLSAIVQAGVNPRR